MVSLSPNNSLPEPLTLQNAAAATGNGTVLDVDGFGSAVVAVSGTFTATVTHEVSMDGTTWYGVKDTAVDGTAGALTRTAAAAVNVPVAGFKRYRARVSAYTDGAVTVIARCAPPT